MLGARYSKRREVDFGRRLAGTSSNIGASDIVHENRARSMLGEPPRAT